jgi:CheY-like chemotaxis protein
MAKQILYVEDNPNNMLLVKRIVEAEGHTLLEATNAADGWQVAVTHIPDLILMDLHLPGNVSGFDLTRKIKQNAMLSQIPVVALTAFGLAEAEQAALEAGCAGFLHKPADIRQIRATIHRYLETPAEFPAYQPVTQPQTAVTYAFI